MYDTGLSRMKTVVFMNIQDVFKKVSPKKLVITTVLTVAILYLFFGIKLPFDFIAPGKVIPASKIIMVENGYKHKGEVYIPTIIYERSNLFFFIYKFLNNSSDLVPTRQHTPRVSQASPGRDYFTYFETEESIYRAKVFALKKFGFRVPLIHEGMSVMSFPKDLESPLKPGDIILEVDKTKFLETSDLKKYLDSLSPDVKTVEVVYARGSNEAYTNVELVVDNDGNRSIGMELQSHTRVMSLPVKVNVNSRNFEGTSAGLPVFIEVMNQLSSEDLTGGFKIAATGTLDVNGNVLPVKGLKYKIAGAEKTGCNYFICPEQNWTDKSKHPAKMKIILVKDIDEVVDILNKLSNNEKI
jgi:Lon-like protease